MIGSFAREDSYHVPSEFFNEGESAGNPSIFSSLKENFFVSSCLRGEIAGFIFRDD